MPSILMLTYGHAAETGAALRRFAAPGRDVVPRDQYALDEEPLEHHAALVIGMHADQRHLAARAGRLAGYLAQGGTIAASGHLAYPFLPDVSGFQPLPTGHLDDLRIHREAAHPIWAGVSEQDLTFRRGVAGFYGRGWHIPPPRARVLHSVGREHRPLDIMWRHGKGRVLLHGGNDLWSFGAGDIARNLFDWLLAGPEVL
ncbi:hypothetical protein EOD42_24135 [Rhodovarius crocodyli]|uniref:ThuA-like domain-containing protein n=1 Tax=Rhodovarius crocodyli TaxID=1979269 RepID=A0A437LX71_9PROT|nr:hypothetical protein [Rhodovarius crocodyli]RVT89984.1 hypothetical protein EOD42_24135 [Rhodovarius crocodyli]